MANENKNIKELVSEDDDPTAELEVLALDPDDTELEADANTSGLARKGDSHDDAQIPVLKADLESRSQTISRLQFDIEQLRAKWLGLEAEISAREEITKELHHSLSDMRDKLLHKQDLLKDRDASIGQLNNQVQELNDENQALQDTATQLRHEIEEARQTYADADVTGLRRTLTEKEKRVLELEDANAELNRRVESLEEQRTHNSHTVAEQSGQLASNAILIEELRRNETRLEAYADTIRQQLTDTQAATGEAVESHEKLLSELASAKTDIEQLESNLESEAAASAALKLELEQQQDAHADEAGQIRDELAAALESGDSLRAALSKAETEIEELKSSVESEAAAHAAIKLELEQHQSVHADETGQIRVELSAALESTDDLREALSKAETEIEELKSGFESEAAAHAAIQQEVEQLKNAHAEEIRQLRFELGEAQETVAQNELVSEQLAADLVETRNHRVSLEEMLSRTEELGKSEIEGLERKNRELERELQEHKEKLANKSEAINCLLAELAKKTEQIDSIGEIEEVIQEIDGRMSERIDERATADKDRLARLLVGSVEGQELRFPLFKERLTIGRTDQNDIQLKAAYVSRRHAVIATEGEVTRIIDWGSKNGIFVNSERVSEHFLKNGDIVAIGPAKFRYEERQKRDH